MCESILKDTLEIFSGSFQANKHVYWSEIKLFFSVSAIKVNLCGLWNAKTVKMQALKQKLGQLCIDSASKPTQQESFFGYLEDTNKFNFK